MTEDGGQWEKEEDKKIRGLEGKQWPSFHSTFDIIEAVEGGRFPDKAIPVKSAPEKQEQKRVSRGKNFTGQARMARIPLLFLQ